MEFALFDRAEAAAAAGRPEKPMVRVAHDGRLLLNPLSWRFLTEQYGAAGQELDVALLFDAGRRRAAVQPVLSTDVPDTARFRVQVMRSLDWPRGAQAQVFVDFWRIRGGEYPAEFERGAGPRLITFDVGVERPSSQRIVGRGHTSRVPAGGRP